MIGDREQAERALAGAGGVHVQAGGLHLDGEHAHLLPLVGAVTAVVVEVVGREHVAHVQRDAIGGRRGDGLAEQRVVRDRRERAVEAELVRKVGIRARARTGDDIHEVQIIRERTGRADADDVVDIIEIVQLPAVDAD